MEIYNSDLHGHNPRLTIRLQVEPITIQVMGNRLFWLTTTALGNCEKETGNNLKSGELYGWGGENTDFLVFDPSVSVHTLANEKGDMRAELVVGGGVALILIFALVLGIVHAVLYDVQVVPFDVFRRDCKPLTAVRNSGPLRSMTEVSRIPAP